MPSDPDPRSPRVFISSTYEDLKRYVHLAEEVLEELSFEFDQFKHWEATGRPSVSECKERVRSCDALVVIVGQTYGWIPTVAEGGDGKSSITMLEVQWAREKPMTVLPFFIEELRAGTASTPGTQEERLLAVFVDGLRATLGKPVSTPATFRSALLQSLEKLRGHSTVEIPSQVGESTQGRYREFLDRTLEQASLVEALTEDAFRGASIAGKGGFGKSALANRVIEQVRSAHGIDVVVYLNSSAQAPIGDFGLFMRTMAASGKPKRDYEASWTWLKDNRERLIEVLLEVYRERRILLLFDAFEHNLEDDGRIRLPQIQAFLEVFLLAEHSSKLLITTREPPLLSADGAKFLKRIDLDSGLPASDAVSLLISQLPDGARISRQQLTDVVTAVHGIPYAIERMTELVQRDRLLELGPAQRHEGRINRDVYEDVLDEFVRRAHSTLSEHAQMVIQARAIFDDPVPEDALIHVLERILTPSDVQAAIRELGRGRFLFTVGSAGLLGIHEFDQESSYRRIGDDGLLDRQLLHKRAADYFARDCEDRETFFDWRSYDELASDIKRFQHLVRAGEPVAAANAMSLSKVEFLNWTGHVEQVREMFVGLDVGDEPGRAQLVKRYALADALVIVGPFEKAIDEFNDVIELARSMGDENAEITALYELGLAYRYSGLGDKAEQVMRGAVERLHGKGESKRRAAYLYGYSLACTYAGDYVAAIRAGKEQVHYGIDTGNAYFIARGNSSLCIPYYAIGMMREAARCARESTDEMAGTIGEYIVGFMENVLGMALCALNETDDAVAAFERGRRAGERTGQRRVEGLVATNLAWLSYDRGDCGQAILHIREAISVFEDLHKGDLQLANYLRLAFEYARESERKHEIEALWRFVQDDYVNPDLVRRLAVAERILAYGDRIEPDMRRRVEAFVTDRQKYLAGVVAELAA